MASTANTTIGHTIIITSEGYYKPNADLMKNTVRAKGIYLHGLLEDANNDATPDICYISETHLERIKAELDKQPNKTHRFLVKVAKLDDKGELQAYCAHLTVKYEYAGLKSMYGIVTEFNEELPDLDSM